eukprot:8269313-Pyramimonas_sp.AAC.1
MREWVNWSTLCIILHEHECGCGQSAYPVRCCALTTRRVESTATAPKRPTCSPKRQWAASNG